MKKLLGLVLLFILVAGISLVFLMSRSNVGSGNWDLTSPANNSYIASFPALVRANQAAIVASLTPPIEWTGEVTQYGRPSARLGFDGLTGSFRYPTFWLGSIGTAAAYIFGPSEQVPVGIPNDDAPGWYAHVASDPSGDPGEKCYLQLGMPNGNGTAQAVGIVIREDLIFVNRKVSGVATGTAAQDAVNLGQMSASISSSINDLREELSDPAIPLGLIDDIGSNMELIFDPSGYDPTLQYIHSILYCGNGIAFFGIGNSAGYVYKSSDYGVSWDFSYAPAAQERILSLEHCGGGIIIAGTAPDGLICRSSNYGVSWSVASDTSAGFLYDLKYCGNGVVLAANGDGNVYKSSDYGATWNTSIVVDAGQVILSLEYCGNGVVLAGTGTGGKIYKSSDSGDSWGIASDTDHSYINTISYCGNGVVIAGSGYAANGRIYRSVDYGDNWNIAYELAAAPFFNSTLYCGNGVVIAGSGGNAGEGELYRSVDYGLTWVKFSTLAEKNILSLGYFGNGILIAGTADDGKIFKSDPNGW